MGIDSMQDCPSCNALNKKDAAFCESCGEDLRADAPPRRRRRKGQGDKLDRRRANVELGKARVALNRVKTFFTVLAVIAGLLFALILMGALQLQNPEARSVALIFTWIWLGIVTFFVIGRIYLMRNPFAWGIALSSLLTVYVVLSTVVGVFPWLVALLTIGSWGCTAMLVNVNRLLRQYPDLAIAKKIKGTHARAERGEISDRVRGKAREESKANWLRLAAIAGVVIVGTALIITAVNYSGTSNNTSEAAEKEPPKLPDYEPVIRRFEVAWENSDKDYIKAMIPEKRREYWGSKLDKGLERGGFTEKFPALRAKNVIEQLHTEPAKVKPHWDIPGARLRTEWRCHDGKWELYEIQFKKPH